ncbi:MAG: c-type cytochrome biogenesis protein CcmI [Pseudomonadales bacterium]|nr:c-type cytochrome biogenesis protein CcmI [Pseudomonadales bacterium]
MMIFWLAVAALCVLAAGFILVPGYFMHQAEADIDSRPAEAGPEGRRGLNVAIYAERAAEYETALAQGDLTAIEYEQLSVELKKNLLAESSADEVNSGVRSVGKLPLLLALLMPCLAILAYADFGLSLGAIDDWQLAQEFGSAEPHDEQAMRRSVQQLASRLKAQPENDDGWFLLAQSYMKLKLYEKSAASFKHLLKKFPTDHGLSSYYAEAIYLADERRFTARANEAIAATLALNPHDITMLEMRALAAFQAGELETSIDYFRRALAAGADEVRAEMINRAITRIEADMGTETALTTASGATEARSQAKTNSAEQPMPEATQAPSATTNQRSLQVLVEVDDAVQVGASTPVFVFARALNGPPMPLAVERTVAGALPKLVLLDESMKMMPGMGLANFDQVQVVARISMTGIANVSPDDYEALSEAIDMTQDNAVIKLRIKNKVQ